MWLDVLNKKNILLTGGYDNKELNVVKLFWHVTIFSINFINTDDLVISCVKA